MKNDHDWYIEHKKNPDASIRLFCFHHSGGGASTYYPWRDYLSFHIEMISIQLPGRENRFTEPLNNNVQDIAFQLSEKFFIYKDKPFFVFGHSLGGLIAFEFIKAVNQLYSLYPRHMIVSAIKAPHLPLRRKNLSQLDNNTLKKELKIYNGIDERILNDTDLLELFLPIIRNDFSIYENYSFLDVGPLPCDLLVLSGDQDQTVNQEEILAWSKYTTGKFEHMSFSGKHFFIKDHKEKLLEIINQIGESHIRR